MGGPGKMGTDPGGQAQAQEDKHRQVEDMKNSILSQVLTQEARARCKY
jgi:DNA-binding TFAR19-related protein (PDSD5 family)